MRNLYRIARWEFLSRFRSRSFFFNTFITPLVFTLLFMLPLYFLSYSPTVSVKLIGIIDLSAEKNIGTELSSELGKTYRLDNHLAEYEIYNISVKNSKPYMDMKREYTEIKDELDSLNQLHNQIKEQRTGYYKNINTPNRQFALDKSYERLRQVREEKELVAIELERYHSVLDSVYAREARIAADSLIVSNVLSSYLVFSSNFVKTGQVEYHSKNAGDLLDTERMEKILQKIIVKGRLIKARLGRTDIREYLRPIHLSKFKINADKQEKWNVYAQFYGPLIGVLLLFMAIFTTGGYLFSGVLLEKSSKVMEVLMSYTSSNQIMGGKIIGLGLLGLMQVLTWIFITILLVLIGLVPSGGLGYLTMQNAFYFLIYFSLGYLFYGAIFIMIGSVFSSEYDAQQVNQFLRTMAIFPVLLSLVVLTEPNAFWIRILSYIPFLSPSFMILRIPLSSIPLTVDIYATIGVMLASIVVVVLLAGKLFRVTTLLQGKRPTLQEIYFWLKKS